MLTPMQALFQQLGEFAYDPVGFVYFAFRWGEGELKKHKGPKPWQEEELQRIADALRESPGEPVQIAIASGHGPGKTALMAFIELWALCTRPGSQGVITAQTEVQLKTRDWVELKKWVRLSLMSDYLKVGATTLYTVDEKYGDEWRFDAIPWSERNPQAFAGLHNEGNRLTVLFDEASEIADIIWETVEGALTDQDTEILWIAFGNPTTNKGRFRECFQGGRFAHRWHTKQIDSRTVEGTNKKLFQRWVDDWGEDSDFVRVRVRGLFPKTDPDSFISSEEADAAIRRELIPDEASPVIVGVDVARGGEDSTVILARQGRDARSFVPRVLRERDLMKIASHALDYGQAVGASVWMIDGTGVGGGVADRLRQLHVPVVEVVFGDPSYGMDLYNSGVRSANRRTDIWLNLRGWLQHGGCIPERVPLLEKSCKEELLVVKYGFAQEKTLRLIPKELLDFSPDWADALAVTFAEPWVDPKQTALVARNPQRVPERYNPFSEENMYGPKRPAPELPPIIYN